MNLTRFSFSTGNVPGCPRHTGQVLWFGGAPNAVVQLQNAFEFVSIWAWTSSPITGSYFSNSARSIRQKYGRYGCLFLSSILAIKRKGKLTQLPFSNSGIYSLPNFSYRLRIRNSVRRLRALPSSVELSAIGCVEPKPFVWMRLACTPFFTSAAFTASARFCESLSL